MIKVNSFFKFMLQTVTQTCMLIPVLRGFPDSSVGKESACNAGDQGWIPGSGRSPGEGNGNPFQYSYLENSLTEEHLS